MPERNRAWFVELYQRHYAHVLRYGYRRVGPDRAPDVAAETFLVAWRRLGDIPDPPLPWLYGVARNTVSELRRRDQRDEHTRSRSARELLARTVPDPAESAERTLVVADALAQLSEADQELLQLSAWEDLAVPSIAQVLGCSTTAAAVRLHRARRRLATVLGPSIPESTRDPDVLDLTIAPAAISRSTL
jgi:RNA polymerase sigma factor (sigma-70 family)